MTLTLSDIQAAANDMAGVIIPTPAIIAANLPDTIRAGLILKLENLQISGSFKARGALYRMQALTSAERSHGVIAMSAGNHAQGVAWHARHLGIPATIVMPKLTPFSKVERTRSLGARVVLTGETLSDAEEHARRLAQQDHLTFIHPYDDERIIAGQGTVGLELLQAHPDIDTLIVPVGGGGLISGIAIAAKAIRPEIEIIGVQAEGYATFVRSPPLPSSQSGVHQTLAEGIAVKNPGIITRHYIETLVDDVVTVDENAIERAVELLLEHQKIVTEGAGAAALAAVLCAPDRFRDRRVGLIVSGGNIDSRLIASILMRGLVSAGRLARLRIEISDAPGTLATVASLIGIHGGNILEVYHQRLFQDVAVKHADLDAVVETTDPGHIRTMINALRTAGFPTRLLRSSAGIGD